MITVRLESGEVLQLNPRIEGSLADLLRQAGQPLNTRCGQRGVCHGCEVRLDGGHFTVDGADVSMAEGAGKVVRSCQAAVNGGDASLFIPESSRMEAAGKVEDSFVLYSFPPSSFVKTLTIARPEAPAPDGEAFFAGLSRACGVKAVAPPLALLGKLSHLLVDEKLTEIDATVAVEADCVHLLDVAPAGTMAAPLGLAVDVGTTTVAALLVRLSDGEILARATMYNQQIRIADDVASRIMAAGDREPVEKLRKLIVEETIKPLLDELLATSTTGAGREDVVAALFAGNTVMSHLLLGLPPSGIGRLPFLPVLREYPQLRAAEVGLAIHPHGVVRIVPSVAGYIGGDVVADIHVSGLLGNHDLSILIDIGTNGEIVLAEKGKMIACATAAGPAFEGAGIRDGCRAADGAIEHLELSPTGAVGLTVIGGRKPVGICGSAIVDFVAQAHGLGFLNDMGRFDIDRIRELGRYRFLPSKSGDGSGVHAFLIAPEKENARGRDIVVSEHDVAEFLKAKGAIYAGMKTLLAETGHSVGDIRHLFIAGGFGRHLDIESAITAGMLPDIDRSVYRVIGNGSLAGAYAGLMEECAWPSYRTLAGEPRTVELNQCEDFEDFFIEALAIPNLDPDEFGGQYRRTEGEPP